MHRRRHSTCPLLWVASISGRLWNTSSHGHEGLAVITSKQALTSQDRKMQREQPEALPVESWVGRGFISLSTIFWYKALRLKGSTVKGRVPVSMAYMFTPLKGETAKCETRIGLSSGGAGAGSRREEQEQEDKGSATALGRHLDGNHQQALSLIIFPELSASP